jgi:hypothetical protein
MGGEVTLHDERDVSVVGRSSGWLEIGDVKWSGLRA